MTRDRSLKTEPRHETDVRPVVAIQRRDKSVWWFTGLAVIAAMLLFAALDARRRALTTPEQSGPSVGIRGEAVLDLVLPPSSDNQAQLAAPGAWLTPQGVRQQGTPLPNPLPAPVSRAPARATPAPYASSAPQAYYPPAPLIVSQPIESAIPGVTDRRDPAAPPEAKGAAARITADRLANPGYTVPQGTLISAVLETGLDSTGAGQARALVTRDVFGFDGTRMLIPRGSRLYGTYEAGIDQGQKRAQIRWVRLLRPDGVTIALDSPSADPLGRAGVKGKVDSHFGARLGNALLSSTFGIGNALISRRVSPVVVVPTGSNQIASPQAQDAQIKPTLHIKPGARASVFVEHDLDFSTVEGEQQ